MFCDDLTGHVWTAVHLSICDREMATRHILTLSEKIQLIRENEENLSYRTLTDKHKISAASVSNIIKRKTKYTENYEQNENP
jgi:hypothetical protein